MGAVRHSQPVRSDNLCMSDVRARQRCRKAHAALAPLIESRRGRDLAIIAEILEALGRVQTETRS